MKFIRQLDYPNLTYVTMTELSENERLAGKSTTIANSGCGLCAAVMVVDKLLPNANFNIEDAIALSYKAKANIKSGTQYPIFAPFFAKEFNFKLETTCDAKRLLYCLKTGGAVVARISGDQNGYVGLFSHGYHYVFVNNVEEDGRICILDPSIKDGKYLEDGRKGKVEVKNDVFALCSLDDLVKDTAFSNPSFYLFWRAQPILQKSNTRYPLFYIFQ